MKFRHLLCAVVLALCLPGVASAQKLKATATAHSVNLSWVASAPPASVTCPTGTPSGTSCVTCPAGTAAGLYCTYTPVTQYNVYRGTASGGETLYASSIGNVTSYSDTSVTAATQYFYQVTALNACNPGGALCESGKSNEVAATIPASGSSLPPNPPVVTVTSSN